MDASDSAETTDQPLSGDDPTEIGDYVLVRRLGRGGMGSWDHTARLWDVTNPRDTKPLGVLTGHTVNLGVVTYSPDGKAVATTSGDRTARLWDVTDPLQPRLLTTLTDHTDAVFGVAFSPDGRTLATTSGDRTARLWDLADIRRPLPLLTLTGHTNAVYGLAFSPDGKTLATTSRDQTVRLWDIDVGDLARRACDMPTAVITTDEWDRYLPDLEYLAPCP